MAITSLSPLQAKSALSPEQSYKLYLKKRLLLEAVIENLICLLDAMDGDPDIEIDVSDLEDNGDYEPLLGWANYINQDCKTFDQKEPYQLYNLQNPRIVIAGLFEIPALKAYKGIFS